MVGNMIGVKFALFGLRLVLNAVGFAVGLASVCLAIVVTIAAVMSVFKALRDWGQKR